MKLKLVRFSFSDKSTSGMLFIDGKFHSYTLEDTVREEKQYGDTAIPYGTYDIKLRKEGGYHSRYTKRFGPVHKGMLWLQDVKNDKMSFEYVYIHTGNKISDTLGCILVGFNQESNYNKKEGWVGTSRPAYLDLYKQCIKALDQGEDLSIEIVSIDDKSCSCPKRKKFKFI
jgi:hypothetical protein